ncbi:MAG: hypothetical protein H6716_25175 [Polyangiaceae bacterium]|nr:hypothetical protein [Polyangiaceae bacterium]
MRSTRSRTTRCANGAIARFLKSLREELKDADDDRAKQLSSALAALVSNDENSPINRLVRETHQARQAVLSAVNPDAPMGIMKATLTTLLADHAKSQTRARTPGPRSSSCSQPRWMMG